MSIAEKFKAIADEVYAKAREDEITEFNGTAVPFPDRKTNPINAAEKFEVITDEVYDKGRDDQWNENWDEFQQNGNRTDYRWAFSGTRWNDVNFKPKYDIVPTNAGELFHNKNGITDLMGILERQNVKLDFSKATFIQYLNSYGKIPRFGVIDTRSCNWLGTTILGENYSIATIDKFILREDGSQSNGGKINFWGACALQNIVIEGTMGANVNFQHSNILTRESLMGKTATAEQITNGKNLLNINGTYYYGGILGALKVLGEGETRTLTLHKTSGARLTEEEMAIVQSTTGWTIALVSTEW